MGGGEATHRAEDAGQSQHPDLGIDGYEEPVLIGEGGFGVVYRARQNAFNRDVAVKVINAPSMNDETRRRFERECQAIGSVSGHPHIVTVYDSGITTHRRPFMTMDYMAQGSFARRLATRGVPGWEQAIDVAVKIAGAVETAHRMGILHRDIKPENILLSAYGEAKLGDFGISTIPGGYQTSSGIITASIAHAAPEILSGKPATEASDIYSLASTIYTLIAGDAPFSREEGDLLPALITRILTEPVPNLSARGVPEPVSAVLLKALAKDPAERYSSAHDFAVALQTAQASAGVAQSAVHVADDDGADVASVAAPVQPGEKTGTAPPRPAPAPAPASVTRHGHREWVAPAPVEEKSKSSKRLIAAITTALLLAAVGLAYFVTRPQAPAAPETPVQIAGAFSERCTAFLCEFVGSSDESGSALEWQWDFGDGTTSTEQNPEHAFGKAGTYTVHLTISDGDGNTRKVSREVSVRALSSASRLTLKLQHQGAALKAIGRIGSKNASCEQRKIAIGRKTPARWKNVKSVVAKSGKFALLLPDIPGTYRAVAAKSEASPGHFCEAGSSTARHEHAAAASDAAASSGTDVPPSTSSGSTSTAPSTSSGDTTSDTSDTSDGEAAVPGDDGGAGVPP